MQRKRPRSPTIRRCQHWLMKSEPHKFSIDDLEGMTISPWDGVRNYAARNHMKAMLIGDKVLFYHSNTKEPGVVGLAEVVREAYDDHTALDSKSDYYYPKATKDSNPWQMVDVRFVEKFPGVVSLTTIKKEKTLQNMALLRQSRLSVQPVTPTEYDHIVRLAKK